MAQLTVKQRLLLAVFTSIILLLDNITTWLAIEAGAQELNPLVRPFLASLVLWTLFTVAKVAAGFYVVHRHVRSLDGVIIWAVIMFLFIRATLINAFNALE